MKINETTSFPYPVLTPWSDDIASAKISTDVTFREDQGESQVSIHCATQLDHPQIVKLIENGKATFGCYIRCVETGLRRLQPFGFPTGVHHFAPGALLGSVHLRPMVWTVAPVDGYLPDGMHSEFTEHFNLGPGAILALDDDQIVEVSRPPLPTVESIFEIRSSEEISEGEFAIDLEGDRITVRMGPTTFELVQKLRQTDEQTRVVLMNCLYVPMVMQVLQEVSESNFSGFEQYRWLHPFRARCELARIDIEKIDLLNDAQRLLLKPFTSLEVFIEKEDFANDATA